MSEKSPQTQQWISLAEAAERCGVNYRTIRRYVGTGRLKAVRIGPRLLKVRPSDVDALMKPIGGE